MTSKPAFEPILPIHWILDWDGTITRRDTLDALVSIAASSKPDSPVLDEWNRVSEAYMADYANSLETLAPGGKLPTAVQEERKLLQALASVEQASLNRVSASGIFAGLTQRLLEEGASNLIKSKNVEIRDGFENFLQSVHHRGHDGLNLLSVNWSRHFISSCLRTASTPIHKGSIYANELDGIESDGVSNGVIGRDGDAEMLIISSGDKLEYLKRLRRQTKSPIVYAGDSWTDIECLLEADLGICIRDEPLGSSQKKLAERLQSLGVHCLHLSDWKQADKWNVVWARDFVEIEAWIEERLVQDVQST